MGTRADDIDAVYNALDALLLAHDFDGAAAFMERLAAIECRPSLLMSALLVSWPWRQHITQARDAV
jgi:hypothetical protein